MALALRWILTAPHLPSGSRTLRIRDRRHALILVFLPANTAYGVGFSPLGLKWNFERHGRLSLPRTEGRCSVHSHNVPTGTNNLNFTPAAALGTHILGEKYNWSLGSCAICTSQCGSGTSQPGTQHARRSAWGLENS